MAPDRGEQHPDRVVEGEVGVGLLHAAEELREAGAEGVVLGDAQRKSAQALRETGGQAVKAGYVAKVFDLGEEAMRLGVFCGVCHEF